MKIIREKRIREEFVAGGVEKIVGQMIKTITGEKESKKRKWYRNICQETGRGRGVIRANKMSRMEYRRRADKGEIEGVRRASW
jgi:ribosomal protein S14